MTAKQFINIHKSGNHQYGYLCTPTRENGKKVNHPVYLGRVINLEEGRFRTKAKGEYIYTLENGYSDAPVDPRATTMAAIAKGSLLFGHVYCVHALLERTGLLRLFRATETDSPDTLLALLMHRLLDCYSDSHASSFLEQTYTGLLYPRANLSSQNISKYLFKIGSEAIRRDFHRRYIAMMYPDQRPVGVLIDSTGLPNDIDIFLTAISNHGGETVNGIRLIYVVDRETLGPIYFRAIPGNVVDVVTLKGTINELKSMNVNIGQAILDAGYNSASNLEELFELGIDFMTRLISNRGLYKELLAKNSDTVIRACNRIVYNKRSLFITVNKVRLPNDRTAYAYIGVDCAKRAEEQKKLALREDPADPMSDEEYENKYREAGMFVMISSLEMDKKEVLPYYYSRQTIEQIFDASKNNARLLPLGVHSLEAFRGHILLSFITTIVYLRLQRIFHDTKFNPIDFMAELRGVSCIVYEDHLQIFEPTAKQKEIMKILGIDLPSKVPIGI
ncbi:MAG: transposase [Candidatus Adiutrix sp.]|jgi:hypothetical protein|nr:transposase [Candidatus Adiutrix sp.]